VTESKKRLDLYLVEKGLALSRTHAQELIQAGQVFLLEKNQRKGLKKSSIAVEESAVIEVEKGPANRFVSRGGLKLEGALEKAKLSVQGLSVLDVGISTGGFTDCLLQKGAAFVLGVDVGHGQVHSTLLQDSRLQVLEGINARNLSRDEQVLAKMPAEKFDLAVMDVSFISIELIIPELSTYLKTSGHLLSLVKPQFEVGVDGLGKGGIVKDASLYIKVEQKIRQVCESSGFQILDYFDSPIEGKDGNREFFVFAKKS
jgi:23S rRNA (cytidine1920-2'-O)/16S rRNA (cytidine1409-2'-O)-methyltransferase